MAKSDFIPDRSDRITWTVTAFCVAGMLVMMAMNGLMEFGELTHDMVCAEHGWAV